MPASARPASLRSRLRLALAALAALGAAIALAAAAAAWHSRRLDDEQQTRLAPAVRAVERLTAASVDRQRAVHRYVISGDPAVLALFEADGNTADAALAELDRLLGDDASVAAALAAVVERTEAWRAGGAEPLIAATAEGQRSAAAELETSGPSEALFADLDEALTTLHDVVAGRVDALSERLAIATDRVAAVAVGGATVLAVAAFLVGLGLVRWLTRPLSAVADAVDQVSAGHLGKPVPVAGPAEIARVGSGVERMRLRLLEEVDDAWRSGVVETEQRERRRIAGELHDDPVQALAAAQLRLQALRPEVADDVGARLDLVATSLGEVQARLRDLMFRLHPPSLDDDGLVAAVEDLLDETFAAGGMCTEVLVSGAVDPPPPVAALAFRATAEAVRNVAKHADASRVTVTLIGEPPSPEGRPGILSVTVADDGAGFDDHLGVGADHGLGIAAAMVRAAGGRWDITSARGSGTHVRFWLPSR